MKRLSSILLCLAISPVFAAPEHTHDPKVVKDRTQAALDWLPVLSRESNIKHLEKRLNIGNLSVGSERLLLGRSIGAILASNLRPNDYEPGAKYRYPIQRDVDALNAAIQEEMALIQTLSIDENAIERSNISFMEFHERYAQIVGNYLSKSCGGGVPDIGHVACIYEAKSIIIQKVSTRERGSNPLKDLLEVE